MSCQMRPAGGSNAAAPTPPLHSAPPRRDTPARAVAEQAAFETPCVTAPPQGAQRSLAAQFQQTLQPTSPAATTGKTAWADLLDESLSDNDLPSPPGGDGKAAPPVAPASIADTLTQSLLVQSFSGLSATCSSSPDVIDRSGLLASDALQRASRGASRDLSHTAPLPAPAGLKRVVVPVQPGEDRRRGYPGLLSMVQRNARRGGDDASEPALRPVSAIDDDPQVQAMVEQAVAGLRASRTPEPALEGMGGSYFLSDESGHKACVFKPCDEEPLAPNNPKQWQGRAMGAPGVKPSVRVGEAALREVAAYLLDHDSFAGVPPACLVECYHPVLNYKVQVPRIESLAKLPLASCESSSCNALFSAVAPGAGGLSRALLRAPDAPVATASTTPRMRKPGSLQAFAEHKCDANDMSPSHFSADNVHRIGIFDVRLLNCDRHTGNLLVRECGGREAFARRAPYSLVPIDHGYALPEALDNPYFEWLFWPQTSIPFSDEAKAYVARLDAAADAAMLREKLPALRQECIRCLEVSTKVLQLCVAAGLTLFEIGSIFSREGAGDQISDLESLCIDARDNCLERWDRLGSGDQSGSGGTTPSAPASPVSGPLSSALAGMSNSVLPAVEEVDSDDADSACMFKMSRQGGAASPCANLGDLSPFTPPALPERGGQGSGDDGSGVGDWVEMSPACSRFASVSPVPFQRPPPLSDVPPAPQSASGINVSAAPPGAFGQRGLMRARRNAWRTKHGGGAMPAYPPLVAASHPDHVQRVFSDLTEGQWRDFMQHIEHWVASELQKGTWKASAGAGPIAGSCPVAFNDRLR